MDVISKAYKTIYRTRRWTATILATGLAVKNGLPHIFPTYAFMPYYASGSTSKFPMEDMVHLLKSTKADVGDTGTVLPFVTTEADVVGAGFFAFSRFRQPCSIGIPKNYFCSNVFELDELNVVVGHKEKRLTGSGPSERGLLDSLILSESAQKFAVARHLVYFKQNWAILQSLLPSAFVLIGYFGCFYGPKLLFLQSTPVLALTIFRFTIACVVLTWVLCKLTKAAVTHLVVNSVDKATAGISKEYAEAGIEYYEKLCSRNKANRVLLGKQGEGLFTAYGNEKDGLLINWNGPTFTERIKNIKKICNTF